MRLTTARYYTPSGVSIQAKGIEPDIQVEAGVTNIKEKDTKIRREENLRGALDKKESKTNGDLKNKEEPLTKVEKLMQDNQVSRAVDLIRGINLYSKKASSVSTVLLKKTNDIK